MQYVNLHKPRPWDEANLRQLAIGSLILGRPVGVHFFSKIPTTDSTTNMIPPSLLSSTLLISWILCIPLVRSSFCNGLLYGSPNIDDCEQALLEIPFAREGSSSRSQTPQLFAEPQFQVPPFHSITNNLRPQSIVQLPKIWKHSKSRAECHLAAFGTLDPYADGNNSNLRLLPHSAREPRGLRQRSLQARLHDAMAEHHRPVRRATKLLFIQTPQRRMDKSLKYIIPAQRPQKKKM